VKNTRLHRRLKNGSLNGDDHDGSSGRGEYLKYSETNTTCITFDEVFYDSIRPHAVFDEEEIEIDHSNQDLVSKYHELEMYHVGVSQVLMQSLSVAIPQISRQRKKIHGKARRFVLLSFQGTHFLMCETLKR
jgi:hypothetical protein